MESAVRTTGNHKYTSQTVAKTDSAWKADAYGRSMLPSWMRKNQPKKASWLVDLELPRAVPDILTNRTQRA